MQYALVPNLSAEIAIPEGGMSKRVLYEDAALKVLGLGFSAGHEFATHSAQVPVTMVFLEGEASLLLGHVHQEVAAGAWLHLEAKLQHSVTARGVVKMMLYLHKSAGA